MDFCQEPVVSDTKSSYRVPVKSPQNTFLRKSTMIDHLLECNKTFIADELNPNSTHYLNRTVKQTLQAAQIGCAGLMMGEHITVWNTRC